MEENTMKKSTQYSGIEEKNSYTHSRKRIALFKQLNVMHTFKNPWHVNVKRCVKCDSELSLSKVHHASKLKWISNNQK